MSEKMREALTRIAQFNAKISSHQCQIVARKALSEQPAKAEDAWQRWQAGVFYRLFAAKPLLYSEIAKEAFEAGYAASSSTHLSDQCDGSCGMLDCHSREICAPTGATHDR